MPKLKKILIIDDEAPIHQSLSAILTSSGFDSVSCLDPTEAMRLIKTENPDLILLDIWMPEMDGHSLLRIIKAEFPSLPVIIISGHAGVTQSVQIAKSGADDFLEKPFSADRLLMKVRTLLKLNIEVSEADQATKSRRDSLLKDSGLVQKTLAKSVVLKGKGLHTGTPTGLILAPLPEDSGIVFEDIATGWSVQPLVWNVDSTSFSTNLKFPEYSLFVVEHLLAVCHIYGLSNVSIKVNREIPIFDGSAREICEAINAAGLISQKKSAKCLTPDRSFEVRDPVYPDRFIRIEPSDKLELDYTFELRGSDDVQNFKTIITPGETDFFTREIAPARTFGFMDEIKELQAAGLGQGGDMDNFLLIDDGKILNHNLLWPDELARHKTLDILGDMMLLGAPLRAKITGFKTGHRHNVQILRALLTP